jgi:hypothetical protein
MTGSDIFKTGTAGIPDDPGVVATFLAGPPETPVRKLRRSMAGPPETPVRKLGADTFIWACHHLNLKFTSVFT